MAHKSFDNKWTITAVAVGGAIIGGLAGIASLTALKWWKSRNQPPNNYDDWDDEMVNTWVAYHYTPPEIYVPFTCLPPEAKDFPMKCVDLYKKHRSQAVLSRALDVGCATGRMSFELAAHFNEVVGLDNAKLCIDKSNELKDNGRASYKLQLEGKIIEEREAIVNPEIDRDRVTFMVGNACALPEDIGQFGMVLITNTLCHLPDPMLFLETMKDYIVPAGILIIVDFYGWDDMYKLPKERWVAGYENDEGEQVGGFEGLKRILCSHFILLEEQNLQCLVKFGARHYSLQIDHATVWMRKID